MKSIYELYDALVTIKIIVRQKAIHAMVAYSWIVMVAVFL